MSLNLPLQCQCTCVQHLNIPSLGFVHVPRPDLGHFIEAVRPLVSTICILSCCEVLSTFMYFVL